MKICYINPAGYGLLNPSYIKKQSYGGAEVVMHDDAIELAKDAKFEMHLLVDADEKKQFTHGRIKVWTLKGKFTDNRTLFSYRLEFWKRLKEINADVYVQRASLGELYLLTGLFCKLHKKKYVHIISEAQDSMHTKLQNPSFLGTFRWITLTKAALKLADALVVLSYDQLGELTPALRRKTRVIYNGKQTVGKATSFEKRKYILWAGRNHPVKRPELLIKLAQHLPKEKIVMAVIGKLPQNVPANVTILQNVPKEKMDALFANAKVLVHTSISEGFGNVYIEAWNNGTPVVTTTDTDERICRHNLGYHSRTFEELAAHVRKAITDKKKWKIQSRNARAYVNAHHDTTRQINEYKKLFTSLASAQEDLQYGKSTRNS